VEKPPPFQAARAASLAAASRIALAVLIAIPTLAGAVQGWEAPIIGAALAAGTLLSASLERGLHQQLLKSRRQRLPAVLRVEASTSLSITAPAAYLLLVAAYLLEAVGAPGAPVMAGAALAAASGARGYAGRVALLGLLYGPARTSILATLVTGLAGIATGWGGGTRLILALATGYAAGLGILLGALRRVGAFQPGLSRWRLRVAAPPRDAWVSGLRLGLAGASWLAGLEGLLVLLGVLVGEAGGRLGGLGEEYYGWFAFVGVLAGPIVLLPLSGSPLEPAVSGLLLAPGLAGLGFRDVMGWVLAV